MLLLVTAVRLLELLLIAPTLRSGQALTNSRNKEKHKLNSCWSEFIPPHAGRLATTSGSAFAKVAKAIL